MGTIINNDFISVFKSRLLNITSRTISVKTLLSERNVKRIDYKPYYQRNYVWDIEKQSFFIESVLLGTEIPPLILFKSGVNIEIIDGRQRFETLKRFKEDDFSLSTKGLMELPALAKSSFNKLDDSLKDIFLNSSIRIFQFEVITDVSPEIEDKVKKEIFRRYNTGITPLTSVEVDAAKYDNDQLSNLIELSLHQNSDFYDAMRKCFFYNEKDDVDLIDKMVDFLRESYVLPHFPISRYARGKNRDGIIDILYNAITSNEQSNLEFSDYKLRIDSVINLYNSWSDNDLLKRNKLLYQAILWGVCVMSQEEVNYDLEDNEVKNGIKSDIFNSIGIFNDENSFHYKSIVERYSKVAEIFAKYFKCNFEIYIKNVNFNSTLKLFQQNGEEARDVMKQLDGLRINKPAPISKPIEEILKDVATSMYQIRPSYQRQEKINESKASSIIESILLGIPLPPIFIYKREDGIKEVIDGQQRLLSIIAFTGSQYRDEYGKLQYAKINNFKLKKTNILNLRGNNYQALQESQQDLIQDFIIDEIIIDQSFNENFEPTDLFIRLNQKPYPIQVNSFEMWNSTVNKDIIQCIKEVTANNIEWFFIKENKNEIPTERTDRMENEELVTLLAYINYSIDTDGVYDKVLGTFKRSDRITCRIKAKSQISDFLLKLDEDKLEKDKFMWYINRMGERIELFKSLLCTADKQSLNDFFNVKNSKTFRRSAQDFYIVWILMHYVDRIDENNRETIKGYIISTLKQLKNTEGSLVDEKYYNDFIDNLNEVVKKCKSSSH